MDGRRGRAKPFAVEPIRRRLEVVHEFHDAPIPTGVTVSRTGRVFVCHPRWEDRVEFTVCELRDGNELPFPSAVPEQAVGRKPMDLQLETSRLVLRPLTLGDLGAVRALLIDPDVRRWMCDGLVLAEWRVRAAIEESVAGFRWHGAGLFAVRSVEDGSFVGYAGLKPAPLGGLELVAAVWPRHWQRGLAAEACRAILDDAFARLGLARVLAGTDAPNFRSLALIASLGFRPLATTPGAFGAIRWFVLARPL